MSSESNSPEGARKRREDETGLTSPPQATADAAFELAEQAPAYGQETPASPDIALDGEPPDNEARRGTA